MIDGTSQLRIGNMCVEELYGNLFVRSHVEMQGSPTTTVTCGHATCNHIIEIENWSTLPYDVEVESMIVDPESALSFFSPLSPLSWKAAVPALAANESDSRSQPLRCSESPGRGRIHCVRVDWKKAGRHRWKKAKGAYPLALTVTVVQRRAT